MTARLDVTKATLIEGKLDRHFFEIVSEMTALEWSEILKNLSHYQGILPYLIYTYNDEKIDKIEELIGRDLGRALASAWFEIYHDGSLDDCDQPSILELGYMPCLAPILNGHLLKKIEASEYDAEFSLFIKKKHKILISEFVDYAGTVSEQQLGRVIFGTAKNDSRFPPLNDYELGCIPELTRFAYLISSIQYMTTLLGIDSLSNDELTDDIIVLLDEADYSGMMKRAKFGETKKRRNSREIKDVESFIVANLDAYSAMFSSLTFSDSECAYLRSVYCSSMITTETVDEPELEVTTQNIPPADHKLLLDPSQDPLPAIDITVDLDIDSSEVNFKELSNINSNKIGSQNNDVDGVSFLAQAKGVFERIKETLSKEADAKQVEESEAPFDELIISSTSKRKRFNPIWVLIIFVGAMSWMFYLKDSNSESSSIIDKKTGTQTTQAYPVVKVHNS